MIDPTVKRVPELSFWHIAAASPPAVCTRAIGPSPLVSVIVPVYNVQRYLENCLASLSAQLYRNIEIILVNDGSTDRSLQICEQHSDRDARIKVHTKPNGGLGSARNYGLEKAKGDIFCFVDSDDYVTPYYVSDFVDCFSGGTDIAVCDHRQVFPDGRVVNQMDISRAWGEVDPTSHLLLSDAECYAWNKAFRASIFEFDQFRFGSGWFEDFAIMPAMIACANSVRYTGRCAYNYIQRPDSMVISFRRNPEKNLDIIEAARKLISLQPVFKPKYWGQYYDWKLLKHVLYYRWDAIAGCDNRTTRENALNALSGFINTEIPWWRENAYVKHRLSSEKDRRREVRIIQEVLERKELSVPPVPVGKE